MGRRKNHETFFIFVLSLQLQSTSACLAVDHRHELVAIGSNEGSFITLNAYNGMHVSTVQVDPESKGRIGCLAFSPGIWTIDKFC